MQRMPSSASVASSTGVARKQQQQQQQQQAGLRVGGRCQGLLQAVRRTEGTRSARGWLQRGAAAAGSCAGC
jgi:hypothetical protein